MIDRNTQTVLEKKLRSILAEAKAVEAIAIEAHAATPTPAVPFRDSPEFEAVYAKLRFVSLGISAMKGIGLMMRPIGEGQMDASIYSASAVFEFFGEALEGPAQEASDTVERLQWAAKGDRP